MDDKEINHNGNVTDQYDDLINLTNQRGLKLGHINVNGLKQKLSEISLLLNTVKLDLLAISKTKRLLSQQESLKGHHQQSTSF